MPDPLTMALIQGGLSTLKWGINKYQNRKGFDDTELARRLKAIKDRGAYTADIRGQIVGGTARTAGTAAANNLTALRGRLASTGMGNSIAGVAAQGDIGTSYQDAVAQTGREVDLKNAMSKIDAGNQYAQAKTSFEENRRASGAQANMQLVQGLGDAAGTYFQGREAQKLRQEQLNQQNFQNTMAMSNQNLAIGKDIREADALKTKMGEYGKTQEMIRSMNRERGELYEKQGEYYGGLNASREQIAKTNADADKAIARMKSTSTLSNNETQQLNDTAQQLRLAIGVLSPDDPEAIRLKSKLSELMQKLYPSNSWENAPDYMKNQDNDAGANLF